MPDGWLRLDVRATIKTDDGEIILVTYSAKLGALMLPEGSDLSHEAIDVRCVYRIEAGQKLLGLCIR